MTEKFTVRIVVMNVQVGKIIVYFVTLQRLVIGNEHEREQEEEGRGQKGPGGGGDGGDSSDHVPVLIN